jgi:hypothetical protein
MATKSLVSTTIETPGDLVPVIETPPPAFVGFLEKNSGKAVELITAGVREGQPYISVDGKFTPLVPFKFHLYQYKQFWTKMPFIDGAYELEETRLTPQNFKTGFQEHYEVVMLVYVNGHIEPARASFRGTKHGAAKGAAKELLEAEKGSWASKGPEYKEAAKLPVAFARFTAAVETVKKTGRGSGYSYYQANSTTKPTTAGEWKILEKWIGDPANKVVLDTVVQAYQGQVAEVLEGVKS